MPDSKETTFINVSVGCDMEGDYCLYIQRDGVYLTEDELDQLSPALTDYFNSDEGRGMLADPPEDEDDEEAGDDLCDLCMTSQVNVDRTTACGKTIGIECGCDKSNADGTCGDTDCKECNATEDSDSEEA